MSRRKQVISDAEESANVAWCAWWRLSEVVESIVKCNAALRPVMKHDFWLRYWQNKELSTALREAQAGINKWREAQVGAQPDSTALPATEKTKKHSGRPADD